MHSDRTLIAEQTVPRSVGMLQVVVVRKQIGAVF